MYPVSTMCRLLGVSSSEYHAWKNRPPSKRATADVVLLERIRTIPNRSLQTYGMPRIHFESTREEFRIGRKWVAHLMRASRLNDVSHRKRIRKTIRGKKAQVIPNLVKRSLLAISPKQMWVANITYVSTWAGFIYLAVTMDAFSCRIVVRAMETHLRMKLVMETLNLAPW